MIIKTVEVLGILEKFEGNAMLAAQALIEKFPAVGNEKNLQRRIQRLTQSRPKKARNSDEYQYWLESPFFTFTQPTTSDGGPAGDVSLNFLETPKPKGRPGKRLSESPCSNTIKKIMEPEIQRLKTFAEQQGVSFDDVISLLNLEQTKKPKTKCIISKEEALAYFFNAGFSSRGWTELRLFLLKFGVELPTRNEIDIEKKALHPTIISQEIKCSVEYADLMKDTVVSLAESEKCIGQISSGSTLVLNAKTGIDGSGSHCNRNQLVNYDLSMEENPHLDPSSANNYILCCVAPLSLYIFFRIPSFFGLLSDGASL